jgi:hypothetical protein
MALAHTNKQKHSRPGHYLPPSSLSTTDLEDAVTTFEMSVRQAAVSCIPTQTVKINHLTPPLALCILLKLINYYWQRSLLLIHHHLHTLFSQAFLTQLSQLWNTKWTSFLRTLHPQSSQFWRLTRYFKITTPSVPPLSYYGTQNLSNTSQSRDTGPTVRAIPPPHPKHGIN